MQQQNHLMLKSKRSAHSSEEKEIKHFSCIDSLNYMHKMKIPQILTLIPFEVLEAGLSGNKKSHKSLICSFLSVY